MRKCFLLLLICACIGCSKRNRIEASYEGKAMFPIDSGVSWTLISYPYLLTLYVDTIVEIGSKNFTRITEISEKIGSRDVVKRRSYFAVDKDNNTIRFCSKAQSLNSRDDSFISTWYKYNAQIGESWVATAKSYFSAEISEFQITLLSRSDTVVSPTKTYMNCYKFYIDDLYESDTEYYDWICPGVGLVKRSFGSVTNKAFILKSFSFPQ